MSLSRWTRAYCALILVGLAAAGLEMALTLASPEYRGLWNGRFDDLIFTWGHPVRPNRGGLREREMAVPKPGGVYRVLVLGDDSTWGPGVAEPERFTALAEEQLRRAHPERTIEVLNVGLSGASPPDLRDVLRFWCEAPVEPDLVVLAFGGGVQRLDSNENRPEQVAFARGHPFAGLAVPRALAALRMPQTARLWRRLLARFAEATGAVPAYDEFLARRHAPDSPARAADAAALRDIRAFCDERRLPPPVFISLNVAAAGGPDQRNARASTWFARASEQAAEAGFAAFHAAPGARAKADAWHINLLNGIHPAHFQTAWADALAGSIETALTPEPEGAP